MHEMLHTRVSCHLMSATIQQELIECGGWKSYEMMLRHAHLAPEHLSQAAHRIQRAREILEEDPAISLR